MLAAGCDSPSLAFQGVAAQQVTVGASVFSVRVRGERAEALRINRAMLPSAAKVQRDGEIAIRIASGCEVVKLDGDQAILKAKLDCSA